MQIRFEPLKETKAKSMCLQFVDEDQSGVSEYTITSGVCNSCGNKGPGVTHRIDGVHLVDGRDEMFHCEGCLPALFERAARGAIDEWLNGGSFHGHDSVVDRRGLTP